MLSGGGGGGGSDVTNGYIDGVGNSQVHVKKVNHATERAQHVRGQDADVLRVRDGDDDAGDVPGALGFAVPVEESEEVARSVSSLLLRHQKHRAKLRQEEESAARRTAASRRHAASAGSLRVRTDAGLSPEMKAERQRVLLSPLPRQDVGDESQQQRAVRPQASQVGEWKSAMFPALVSLNRRELFAIELWSMKATKKLNEERGGMSNMDFFHKARGVYRTLAEDYLREEREHFPQRHRLASRLFGNYEHLLQVVDDIFAERREAFKLEIQDELHRVQGVMQRHQDERDEAVRKREEAEAEAERIAALNADLRQRLEVFQKYAFIKTGMLELDAGRADFGVGATGVHAVLKATGPEFQAKMDELLPSQLHTLMKTTPEVIRAQQEAEFKKRLAARRTRTRSRDKVAAGGDDDGGDGDGGSGSDSDSGSDQASQASADGMEMRITGEFIRHNITDVLEQLDQRAADRTALVSTIETATEHETDFLAEVSKTLEMEMSTSETRMNAFLNNILDEYKSRAESLVHAGTQTDFSTLAAGRKLRPSSRSRKMSTPRSPQAASSPDNSLRSMMAGGISASSADLHARSVSVSIPGGQGRALLLPKTRSRSRSISLSPKSAAQVRNMSPKPHDATDVPSSTPTHRRRLGIGGGHKSSLASDASEPPPKSSPRSSQPTQVKLGLSTAGDRVVKPLPDIPIFIPPEFRRLIGTLPPDVVHDADLTSTGLVAMVSEIVQYKIRANHTDDALNRPRQAFAELVYDFFLHRFDKPTVARQAMLETLRTLHDELGKSVVVPEVRWFAYFCGLSDQYPKTSLNHTDAELSTASAGAWHIPSSDRLHTMFRNASMEVRHMTAEVYTDTSVACTQVPSFLALQDAPAHTASIAVADLAEVLRRVSKHFPFPIAQGKGGADAAVQALGLDAASRDLLNTRLSVPDVLSNVVTHWRNQRQRCVDLLTKVYSLTVPHYVDSPVSFTDFHSVVDMVVQVREEIEVWRLYRSCLTTADGAHIPPTVFAESLAQMPGLKLHGRRELFNTLVYCWSREHHNFTSAVRVLQDREHTVAAEAAKALRARIEYCKKLESNFIQFSSKNPDDILETELQAMHSALQEAMRVIQRSQ